MSILSRQAIEKRLTNGDIKITPAPLEEHFDSDSVDVHLGDKVYEWEKQPDGATITVALWKPPPEKFRFKTFADRNLKDVKPDNYGVITLKPKTFYLADLRQHTVLPPNIAMHIQGKSMLARLGVMVHLTAPHAHAGW